MKLTHPRTLAAAGLIALSMFLGGEAAQAGPPPPLPPPGPPRLTSVDELRCLCAIDVRRNPSHLISGDYVECIAHFSNRMVGTGVLTHQERADEIVRAAHLTDAEILQLEIDCPGYSTHPCDQCSGTGCEPGEECRPPCKSCPEGMECRKPCPPDTRRWGSLVDIDHATYPIDGTIDAIAKLWNFTGEDILLWTGTTCDVTWTIHDDSGAVVRTEPPPADCGAGIYPRHIANGEVVDVPLPGLTLRDDSGSELPPGYYYLEARWSRVGPNAPSVILDPDTGVCLEGTVPYAAITFKIITPADTCAGCPDFRHENHFPDGNCFNHVDDDCDGLLDCCDEDCKGQLGCQEKFGCHDGIDNDCNGDLDCCDDYCRLHDAACTFNPPAPEICDDGYDNDCDHLIDCADSDCTGAPGC